MSELKKFLKELSKTQGVTVAQFGDLNAEKLEVIPTGSFSLDTALGVGGWPRGRIIELFGAESSGKTLLALLAMAEAQKLGLTPAMVDVEQSFDPSWAAKHGVDVNKLIITQPDYGEQALAIVEDLVKQSIGLVVVDSIAALVPQAELESDMEQQSMGLQARMMGKALRRLVGSANKHKTTVIFINQLRQKIGGYGNPEITPGGMAMKFYSSVRVRMSKESGSDVKVDGRQVGHTVKVVVQKNKVAAPYGEATFDLNYFTGINREAEILQVAVAKNIIERPNNVTYKFGDQSWRGRDATIKALTDDKKLHDKLVKLISGSEESTNGKK